MAVHFGEPEAIPIELGGGLIITGPREQPHLVGRAWRRWCCQACADRQQLAAARYRDRDRRDDGC